ncbi:MAG TPA: hypothetical protein VGQ04_13645 [Chitinophagaceae bacterium]|jgi:hypothetical protein|nr:hypothetical protein [Chitinophagaceae bacterium]
MKKLLVISYWLLVSFMSKGHPGIGIVKDSKGNIYYTDLAKVWKISFDGSKTVIVSGVHTHELYIDEHDNLYGEHLWYNGESQNTWGYYVWCLKNTGQLVKEINPTEGFRSNYSFARDSVGNMYWVERFTISRIMKKTKSGEIIKLAEGKFGFIGWLTCTKNGSLYFTENNKLHRLSPDGKLETLANNIGSKSTDLSMMGHNYDSYGIWTDAANNVYLAMIDSKKIIRIGANGNPQTILASNSMWTVCSGIFDNNGNMWVLENSLSNEVRARKITKEELTGNKTANSFATKPHLFITFFTMAGIVLLFLGAKMILNKRKQKLLHLAI